MRHQITQGTSKIISLQVYLDGVAITPSSCSVYVFKPGADALNDTNTDNILCSGTASISTNTLSYTISSSYTTEANLGEGYRVRWNYSYGGVDYRDFTFMDFVKQEMRIVITDEDLKISESILTRSSGGYPNSQTSWKNQIEMAFQVLYQDILSRKGIRPNLLLDQEQLRLLQIYKTLEIIFSSETADDRDLYQYKMERYSKLYSDLLETVVLYFDRDNDGAFNTNDKTHPQYWVRKIR